MWTWRRPGSRYVYDHRLLAQGWEQWDTDRDTRHFGIWICRDTHETFTYCEGDCMHVVCDSPEAFLRELVHLVTFYGTEPANLRKLARAELCVRDGERPRRLRADTLLAIARPAAAPHRRESE